MFPYDLIDKYYPEDNELKRTLLLHGAEVAGMALYIAAKHPELGLDRDFLFQAGLLHDIGIFKTDAPGIHCHGRKPYVCHGYLGAEILRAEGYDRLALVCERHTGAGISLHQIKARKLPLPQRDMIPESPEEEVICFCDKFFSKSHPHKVKSPAEARASLQPFGEHGLQRFDAWCKKFL